MENPLVSIIIPVYNTSSYLKCCLNSVLEQSYKNFEIICVDDGSTDNSFSILSHYSKKNNRIKVLKQKNKGQSAARNNALNIANGEFVMFLDSDDYLHWDTIKSCVDIVNEVEDSNGVVFNGLLMKNGKDAGFFLDENLISSSSKLLNCCTNECIAVFINVALLFASKKIIDENNLRFKEGRLYEDAEFCAHYMSYAKNIYWLNKAFYYYNISRQGSTSTNASKNYNDMFWAFNKAKEYFVNAGRWSNVEYYCILRFLSHINYTYFSQIVNSNNKAAINDFMNELTLFVNKIQKHMFYALLTHFPNNRYFLLNLRNDTPDYMLKTVIIKKNKNNFKYLIRTILSKLNPTYKAILETREQVNYISWKIDNIQFQYDKKLTEMQKTIEKIYKHLNVNNNE